MKHYTSKEGQKKGIVKLYQTIQKLIPPDMRARSYRRGWWQTFV